LWLDITFGLVQSRVSHVYGVATIVHPVKENVWVYLAKVEISKSCLLSVENLNGSRHLVLWSLGTLTSLKDRVRKLVA